MKELLEIVKGIKEEDFKKYEEIMAYCDLRVTADEGIPAIIGLDDLTADRDTVYIGAEDESDFNITMALGALIFESLYAKRGKEKLGSYPAIAPAMSATAELYFHQDQKGNPIQYREVIKKYLKPKE